MNEELEKVPYKDLALKVMIKSFCSAFPMANVVCSAVSDYFDWQQQNNLRDVLSRFESMLKSLAEKEKNIEYLSSAEFARDMLCTLQKSQDELHEEKRQLYAKYLTACCCLANANCNNKTIFLDYMGRIDYLDYVLLAKLRRGRSSIGSRSIVSLRLGDIAGFDRSDIQLHLDYLVSLGLLEQCSKEEITNPIRGGSLGSIADRGMRSDAFYKQTMLGSKLLEFVQQADSNDSSDKN